MRPYRLDGDFNSRDWLTPQEVGNLAGGLPAKIVRDAIHAHELPAKAILSKSGRMTYFLISREVAEWWAKKMQPRMTR